VVVCSRTATQCVALHACVYRIGVHSCRLNSVLCTDSTAVPRSVMVECTQGIRRDWNIFAWLSRKVRIFAATMYRTKRATWNGSHGGLGFYMNRCAFHEDMMSQNDFHIFAQVTLTFNLSTLLCQLTRHVGKLSSKCERCTVFRLRVITVGTRQRQMDRRTCVTLNAAYRGRPHNNGAFNT